MNNERKYFRLPETNEEVDKILVDNNAVVMYNEHAGSGNCLKIPMWYLYWKHGIIGIGYEKSQKSYAKLKSSVFILLWNTGLDISDSEHLSSYWTEKHIDQIIN